MRFDVDAYRPVTHELDGREELTLADARELRLEYAGRLERDVLQGQRVHGD
jgi:hypothetical protein